MFERYTESARRALYFARYEVSQFGATQIGSEHLLLGLIRETEGLVGGLLAEAKVSREALRADIERISAVGEKIATSVEVPFGAETQAVLRAAAEEADRLSHAYIGTEHLLLGLLRVEDSKAASVLTSHGLRLDDVRRTLVALLGESPFRTDAQTSAGVIGQIDRIKQSVRQLVASDPDSEQTRILTERVLDSLETLKRHLRNSTK